MSVPSCKWCQRRMKKRPRKDKTEYGCVRCKLYHVDGKFKHVACDENHAHEEKCLTEV